MTSGGRTRTARRLFDTGRLKPPMIGGESVLIQQWSCCCFMTGSTYPGTPNTKHTLPNAETIHEPENGQHCPFLKGTISIEKYIFQPVIFRCELLVSGRVRVFIKPALNKNQWIFISPDKASYLWGGMRKYLRVLVD